MQSLLPHNELLFVAVCLWSHLALFFNCLLQKLNSLLQLLLGLDALVHIVNIANSLIDALF